MNRNHLKIIACASMLADHIAILLCPQYYVLRWFGRLAMPLFAFFIGEGCRYTKNRKKYFLSVFLLGLLCQAVYLADDVIEHGGLSFGSGAWYLNILLSFSCAIPLGYLTLDLKAAIREKDRSAGLRAGALLALGLALAAGVNLLFYFLRERGGSMEFDYGIFSMLLPVSTLLFDDKRKKLFAFASAVLVFCACTAGSMPFVWWAMGAAALLALYNGKPGKRKLKWAFYVFYPAHLAVLYLISIIF